MVNHDSGDRSGAQAARGLSPRASGGVGKRRETQTLVATHNSAVRQRDRRLMQGLDLLESAGRGMRETGGSSVSGSDRGSPKNGTASRPKVYGTIGIRRSGRERQTPCTPSLRGDARRRKPRETRNTMSPNGDGDARVGTTASAVVREPLLVGSVVKLANGTSPETRQNWGPAPYYLARVHEIVQGAAHNARRARTARRTRKDPASLDDFEDEERVLNDAEIYSLQWFVPLDALVAVCPTANACLTEAEYPLEKVCDVSRSNGRVELVIWRPSTGGTHANETNSRNELSNRESTQTQTRLYSRSEFADVNLDVKEITTFYDDKDLDENMGVSCDTKYVWRFVFDPRNGFDPDPRKTRKVCVKMGSKFGTCHFNNFHVTDTGYVLCDGCDQPHHLRCVGIDPKNAPPPPKEQGFKPNGLANEIGAVRGVRCQVRETGENKTADVGTANALNPNPNGTANTLNPNPKAARKKSPSHTKSNSQKSFFGDGAGVSEPWFCGEACRRKDVTK